MQINKIQINKGAYKYIALGIAAIALIGICVGIFFSQKNDRINILCMGIDKYVSMDERHPASNSIGQADVILLVSIDSKGKEIDVISIPRDIMVMVEKYTSSGKYLGDEELQLCLQYAYADGMTKSCELMQERVKEIFDDIEIDAYAAINFNGIMEINDAIGGVEVTIKDDYTRFDPLFEKGETILLKGNKMLKFIRSRDLKVAEGAYARIDRQKDYLTAFLAQSKSVISENPGLISELYTLLKDDMVTNLGVDEVLTLATTALKCSPDKMGFYKIQGEIRNDGKYECFYPDEDHIEELLKILK